MATTQEPSVDGIESYGQLSTFQNEALLAIAQLKSAGEDSYGLAIKRELEVVFDQDINHGRLYPNLDQLVEAGLVEKEPLDKRTNEYTLTREGEQYLIEQKERMARIVDGYLDSA